MDELEPYLHDLKKFAPVSQEVEVDLATRMKKGDVKAREQLITANLRFVVSVAKEYQHRGLPLADLVSIGNMGLLEAIDRFDVDRGFKFISYAVWWIRQKIQFTLSQGTRLIRLPTNQVEMLQSMKYMAAAHIHATGHEPTDEEIAEALEVNVKAIEHIKANASADVISLDELIWYEDETPMYALIEDTQASQPDAESEDRSQKEAIELALSSLDKRDAVVIRLYFGLDGEGEWTLDQIGKKFNLTRERVRQIKAKALRLLRHPNRKRILLGAVQQSSDDAFRRLHNRPKKRK